MLFLTHRQMEKHTQDMIELTKKKSQWKDIRRRFYRNKLGMLGLTIVAILIILAVFAPVFTTYDPATQNPNERFANPSLRHFMGTDNFGRDLWSRLIYGGRISLLLSVTGVIISSAFGVALGSSAAYFGGKIDLAITRLLDILMAIPQLLLAVTISAALGTGMFNTAMAISISSIPSSMRIMRSTVLSIKSNDFVEAARATGSKHSRIISKHILPNTIAPFLVNSTLHIGGNIMAISGLSFVGLGVPPPTPEWGSILSNSRTFIRDCWPVILFPSLFIFLTVFGVNLFGDGLRDALDPRLKD